jgi:capsular polysaccharide biosynthesis protein
MLLERLETARISEQLEDSENKTKFKIIEPARFPLKPVKPNKIKLGLMGFMLGAMAGFGCIYLVEYSDQSFKEVGELKAFFDIPVLGAISKIVTEG